MKNLLKKALTVSVLVVMGLPLFAKEDESKSKAVAFSISAGVSSKYQLVGEDKVDLAESARPVVALSLENSGASFLPAKFSVGAMPNEWKFVQGQTEDGFKLFGTADIRLLSFDGFKLYAGAGAIYDSVKKTAENTFTDCLTYTASAQMGLKLSDAIQLVVYTHIPFEQIKAYIDQRRGVADPESLAPTKANAGILLSLEL